MEPIMARIYEATQNQKEAFNVVTDAQGREYNLMSTENGALWINVQEDQAKKAEIAKDQKTDQPVIVRPTITVGTFSKNGNMSYFSISNFDHVVHDVSSIALGALIGKAVAKWIYLPLKDRAALQAERAAAGKLLKEARSKLEAAKRSGSKEAEQLAQAEYDAALTRALKVAEQILPRGGALDGLISRLAKFPKIVAGIGSFIIATVAIIVFDWIWNNFLVQDYYIESRVYNFDEKRSWEIQDWYHDNGIVAGGEQWQSCTLPPASSKSNSYQGTD